MNSPYIHCVLRRTCLRPNTAARARIIGLGQVQVSHIHKYTVYLANSTSGSKGSYPNAILPPDMPIFGTFICQETYLLFAYMYVVHNNISQCGTSQDRPQPQVWLVTDTMYQFPRPTGVWGIWRIRGGFGGFGGLLQHFFYARR